MVREKALNASQLGELEAEVMNVLWEIGDGTVQDVLSGLRTARTLAYTTVMTVLSRLVDKGFLAREKQGRAFVYRPLVSQGAIADSALNSVVDRFFDGMSSRAVAHLLGRSEEIGREDLARLESEVRKRRKSSKR